MTIDNIVLGIMCLVAVAGLILGAIAVVRSVREINGPPPGDDGAAGRQTKG
jgi:hypothetical protein